jgi:hypothetical protein
LLSVESPARCNEGDRRGPLRVSISSWPEIVVVSPEGRNASTPTRVEEAVEESIREQEWQSSNGTGDGRRHCGGDRRTLDDGGRIARCSTGFVDFAE